MKCEKAGNRTSKDYNCSDTELMQKILGPLKKLDERSKRLVFVGYAPTGYRLRNITKRKIVIARDVFEKYKSKTDEESNQEK